MLLKKGSSGEDVKRLQAKLGIKADGAFGPGTESNVKEWQASNGLTADGIVGDTTWSKMFGVNPQITDTVTQVAGLALDKLKGHVPQVVLEELSRIATQFGITNNLRLSHFLAQCAHESGAWKYKLEIASGKAYEGRKDLGNTQAGDGVRFKGRGYIQLTGRANYGVFSQFIGEDCVSQPELVATKYPLASAAFFFNRNKLWAICDQGATDEVITKVSKRVNGGTNGLADRLKKFKVYHDLLK
ncbi:Glycoside hydrolase, family 19, catalytic [uncultured Caudovirales phage]|uniref:Glycoside hydrolase, family 19, catalytic n=1 Tax=uncultured Caudovirales phage TaxID=2100421 RepID=A0A6J5RMQ9_9CAUD|nr:Glycoside hydrolase, family 19, catalytic [uncultured Caudovirales phage]CAB4193104.1 Glycoside hydrolase, family 19, catalytic [uncultured Caudovirales phage]